MQVKTPEDGYSVAQRLHSVGAVFQNYNKLKEVLAFFDDKQVKYNLVLVGFLLDRLDLEDSRNLIELLEKTYAKGKQDGYYEADDSC